MGHSHSHHHGPLTNEAEEDQNLDEQARSDRARETKRITLIGAVVDLLLGVVKIIVGLMAQSQALVADGIHSFSDLATDAVVLYAAKHAHKEADEEHPYGHGRIETVATVGLGVALMGVAVGISIDAVWRVMDVEKLVVPGVWALVVAAISVVAKEVIYRISMQVADKYNSNMLRANAWHSRTDAISSIIVIVGVAGAMMGWIYLDAIAAIGVAIMVAKIGWDLSWDSLQELVDKGLEPERVEKIRDTILNVDGVESLHVLRTRMHGGEALADVHIQVDPYISVSEGHYISETVRSEVIHELPEVTDVMVHIDPEDDELVKPIKPLPLRDEMCRRLKQAWANIPAVKDVEQIHLHYLENAIEVEVLLPLSVLSKNDANILEQERQLAVQFSSAVEKIGEIRSVSLRFTGETLDSLK